MSFLLRHPFVQKRLENLACVDNERRVKFAFGGQLSRSADGLKNITSRKGGLQWFLFTGTVPQPKATMLKTYF